MYNHKIKTSFVSPWLRHLWTSKSGFNLIIIFFYICGKLFIIQCNAINNYYLIFSAIRSWQNEMPGVNWWTRNICLRYKPLNLKILFVNKEILVKAGFINIYLQIHGILSQPQVNWKGQMMENQCNDPYIMIFM